MVFQDRINRLNIVHNDNIVLSSGNDGLVNYWSIEDGQLMGKLELPGRIVQTGVNSSQTKLVAASYGSVHVISTG